MLCPSFGRHKCRPYKTPLHNFSPDYVLEGEPTRVEGKPPGEPQFDRSLTLQRLARSPHIL